ncbi:MAG TPA: hypothetical protein VH333_21210 [Pseudonocardiaceae bacterium]|jgi:hypothetical protein|nr:hypothetical protein [Pseudonocardiaceae bacterium]
MAGPIPLLTADEVDNTLAKLATDGDRIAGALVALESHPGHQFLSSTRLTGRTTAYWDEAKADITLLYQRFSAYQTVIARAKEVRARRGRPGATELSEISALLRGPSIELATEEIPLQQRNLTGPDTVTSRMTLAQLVAAMDTAFGRATEVVVAADEVWSAFVHQADALDAQLDTARELAASLGLGESRDPLFNALEDIGTELADLRARAFADPLAFYLGEPGDGEPELGELIALDTRLATVRAGEDRLAAVRVGVDERIARANGAIDGLDGLVGQARQARDLVLDKIAGPAIADVPSEADRLRAQLASLADAVARQRWASVSDELTALAAATDDVTRRVQDVLDTANALLGRRSELRGRLDAYRVKAAVSRLAEDPEIAGCYQQAYDLLWTVPCDLRAATRALNRYQQAIAAKGSTS